jgi:hypothetical protein
MNITVASPATPKTFATRLIAHPPRTSSQEYSEGPGFRTRVPPSFICIRSVVASVVARYTRSGAGCGFASDPEWGRARYGNVDMKETSLLSTPSVSLSTTGS